MISIGISQTEHSEQAGRSAAQKAIRSLTASPEMTWALAFCGGRHDPEAALQGIQAELGEVMVVGGSMSGAISNNFLSYSGYECAVAMFSGPFAGPTIIPVAGLDGGELQAGRQLGARLHEVASDGDTVLLFYDSIHSSPPPVLHVGSYLLNGVYETLGDKDLKLIGAGTLGDLTLTRSFIFDGRRSVKHAGVAVVLPSGIQSHTMIMHGCTPISPFLEITKIEGAVVYELDGRPALEVLQETIGRDESNLSLLITLGEKHGDPYTPYDESRYVNRLILSSNPADGSVTLFEADFDVGTRVQVMSRDNQMMIESVNRLARKLLDSLGTHKPLFALYIDCAGRTCGFSGAESEEAAGVQAELGLDIPLLGLYSGVEIAPLLGRSRPLDWTGVLTLFTS